MAHAPVLSAELTSQAWKCQTGGVTSFLGLRASPGSREPLAVFGPWDLPSGLEQRETQLLFFGSFAKRVHLFLEGLSA